MWWLLNQLVTSLHSNVVDPLLKLYTLDSVLGGSYAKASIGILLGCIKLFFALWEHYLFQSLSVACIPLGLESWTRKRALQLLPMHDRPPLSMQILFLI